jgi:hypothetical protein
MAAGGGGLNDGEGEIDGVALIVGLADGPLDVGAADVLARPQAVVTTKRTRRPAGMKGLVRIADSFREVVSLEASVRRGSHREQTASHPSSAKEVPNPE